MAERVYVAEIATPKGRRPSTACMDCGEGKDSVRNRARMSSDDPIVPILCPPCRATLEQTTKMLEVR
jgi:hypothetical protein